MPKRGKKGDGTKNERGVDFKPLVYSFSGTTAAPTTTGTDKRPFGKWGMEGPYFTNLKRYAPGAGFGRNGDAPRNQLWSSSENRRVAELERVLEEAAAAGSSVEAVKAANRARLRAAADARAETLARARAEAGYGAPAAAGYGAAAAGYGAPAPAAAAGYGAYGAPAAAGYGAYGAPAAAAGYGAYGAPAAAAGYGAYGAPSAAAGYGAYGAPAAAAGYGAYGAPAAAAGYGASASGSSYPAVPDPRNYIPGYGTRYHQNFEGGSYTKKRNNRNNRKSKKASRKSRRV